MSFRPTAICLPGVSSRPGLSERPKLGVRLQTFLKAPALDEALAGGADPLASEELILRSKQLVEPATRKGFAEAIERLIEQAASPPRPVPGPAIFRQNSVNENRTLLLLLASRLRDDQPHGLCGLAMVDLLIRYGDSALYRAESSAKLAQKLGAVLAALDARGR